MLVYHLLYALLTISFAAARDVGNELFGFTLYFNGIYLLLLPVNYASYLLLQRGFGVKPIAWFITRKHMTKQIID